MNDGPGEDDPGKDGPGEDDPGKDDPGKDDPVEDGPGVYVGVSTISVPTPPVGDTVRVVGVGPP